MGADLRALLAQGCNESVVQVGALIFCASRHEVGATRPQERQYCGQPGAADIVVCHRNGLLRWATAKGAL